MNKSLIYRCRFHIDGYFVSYGEISRFARINFNLTTKEFIPPRKIISKNFKNNRFYRSYI